MTVHSNRNGAAGASARKIPGRAVIAALALAVFAFLPPASAQEPAGESEVIGPQPLEEPSPRVESPSGRYPGKVPMERRRIETLPEPMPMPEVEQQFRIPLDLFGGEKKQKRTKPADDGGASGLEPDVPLARRVAILQGLDKITGRVSTIEAPIGRPVRFGSLVIVARTCNKRPPEEPPETTAFLDIYDDRPSKDPVDLFSGWMFASSPALNALEHPVYDVWVADCRIESGETSSEIE